jgi:hypothetical protein
MASHIAPLPANSGGRIRIMIVAVRDGRGLVARLL